MIAVQLGWSHLEDEGGKLGTVQISPDLILASAGHPSPQTDHTIKEL